MLKFCFRTYRLPIALGIALLLFSTVFIYFASQYTPYTIPQAPLLFFSVYIFVVVVVIQTTKKRVDLPTAVLFTLLPMSIPFIVVSLMESISLPSLIIALGLSGITFSVFYAAYHALRALPKSHKQPKRPMPRILFGSLPTMLYVTALTFAFALISLYGISKQALVDEPLWIFDRVERYSANFLKGDLYLTRPSDKPGVTISLLSSPALFFYHAPSTLESTITPRDYKILTGAMRTPIVLFVAFLLPVFFSLLRHIYTTRIALVSITGIALSPLLIGMSRIINPDAVLWILLPLSIFSFYYGLRSHNRRIVLLAGIFLGLSLLTKYVANILLVFYPLMIVLMTFYDNKDLRATHIALQQRTRACGAVFAVALAVYVALLPSAWVYPLHILKGTLLSEAFESLWLPYVVMVVLLLSDLFWIRKKKSFLSRSIVFFYPYRSVLTISVMLFMAGAIVLTFVSSHFGWLYDYQSVLMSPKSAYRENGLLALFFSGFYSLIYGINAVLLIFALLGFVSTMFEKNIRIIVPTVILALFIPLYFLGATLGHVAPTLRYEIALYPLMAIFAAIGFSALLSRFTRTTQMIIGILIGASLLFSLSLAFPYYLSFNSILLPQEHILNIKDMGDGSYQAAHYLNGFENARELSIWADKAGVCAAFVGTCTTTLDQKRIAAQNLTFDYYVISRTRENLISREARREIRLKSTPQTYTNLPQLYDSDIPTVYEIPLTIRDTNTIRIIDNADIDIYKTK